MKTHSQSILNYQSQISKKTLVNFYEQIVLDHTDENDEPILQYLMERQYQDRLAALETLLVSDEHQYLIEDNYKEAKDSMMVVKMFYSGLIGFYAASYLINVLLVAIDVVKRDIAYWEFAEENLWWHILEKTPYYWFKYLRGEELSPKNLIKKNMELLKSVEQMCYSTIGRLLLILQIETGFQEVETFRDDAHECMRSLFQSYNDLLNEYHLLEGCLFDAVDISDDIFQESVDITAHVNRFPAEIRRLSSLIGKKSVFSRYLILSFMVGISTYYVYNVARNNAPLIYEYMNNAGDIVKSFYEKHVMGAIKNILNTIRYDNKEDNVHMNIALESSKESLGRMVANYFAKHNEISSDEIPKIIESGKNGDLSHIMPYYEKTIEKPIKNIFFGDFVRLLLIQVQKQKVDLERSLVQADKLLRSNELNFQIIAAIPTIIFFYLSYRLYANSKNFRKTHGLLRDNIRQMSRLFNTSSDENLLTDAEYGNLVYILNQSLHLSDKLPKKQKQWLQEDFHELENQSYTASQKQSIIYRIYGTYAFIKL
eukprot:TRINITY_DN10878_c0_g1_i1.p1 TRINITY_DN10878_c0_g1~~TRINITY_DN10878_c0_g1_i1.p1  ORF type:complete len:540 (+),score=78.32 TRINITY_DN10878_c0_g1_i1:344-1963(+)